MSTHRLWIAGVSSLCLAALGAGTLQAQHRGVEFRAVAGYESIGGDYGEFLNAGTHAELAGLWQLERIRLGGGFSWISYGMSDPYEGESFNNLGSFLFVGVPFEMESGIRPYVEARLNFKRLRPDDGLFFEEEEPEETEEEGVAGEEGVAFNQSNFGGQAIVGVEIPLRRSLALDLSARFSRFSSDELDLTEHGLGMYSSGSTWGIYVGAFWYP